MSDTLEATTAPSYIHYQGRFKGLAGWIFSTDHKRIGVLYMVSILFFFVVAVLIGLGMRLELIAPGRTIVDPATYNAMFTMHGVIMIFLFIIPSIPAIFGNFCLPIMIGARDMAFPKINLLSWWLLIIGALMAISTLFFGGLPDTGWTFYAPYSISTHTNVSLSVLAAFILGFSSILTGLNVVATIHRLRAPGMTFFKMPLFGWAMYSTAWIQILATPVIGLTLLLIFMERVLHVGIFDPTIGGDPILYEHLFWIYSHPAVYVMVLPAMGVVTEIIPTFSRRKIFGYKAIAFSSLAIAFAGSLVWGHHMFVSGESDLANVVFSFLTFMVAIPTAIKVFNWLATLYKGSISLEAPMLYALAFIFNFGIGGLTGLVLATIALDVHLHDTYFVVAHFHYTMFGGAGFGVFAAFHYWWPKMTGKMYNLRTAKIAFWLTFFGFHLLWFPLFIAGILGNPRRYYDYPPRFQIYHVLGFFGAVLFIIGFSIMLANLIGALGKKSRASANPWGGLTLEWTVPSPPPHENFDAIPTVTEGPYEYPEELAEDGPMEIHS